jgi:hypothetical protein
MLSFADMLNSFMTLSIKTNGITHGILFLIVGNNKTITMEKRIFGIILTVLGIAGLIMAAVGFVNNGNNWRELIVYGILGFIFFFSGISLIRTTKDVINRNEHVS